MDIGNAQKLFKNETVKDMTDSPGQWSKLRFVLYCESGNIYSAFLKPEEVEQIRNRYHEGDPVKVTYTEREYVKDGEQKIGYNLEGMSEVDQGVELEPQQAVLATESAVESTPSEKPPPDKGKGTPEPQKPLKPPTKDVSIVRQVSWKCSAWIMQALNLGENVEENVKLAVTIAHSIEEDINR